ncbi:hypothetical protein BASA81_000053 [Batrachochytrium salamandrivorans]|nr:hypothetical protein BASA81_000053 [Batrachochytrium salamandrivorans]
MTKFGARLLAERREEFADGYVRYDVLKQTLKSNPSAAEFQQSLLAEIKRVCHYSELEKHSLFSRLESLEKKWENVRLWKTSGFSESDSLMEETYSLALKFMQDLDFFIDFTTLNVLGVQKLVKKFERHVGGPSHLIKTLTASETDELNVMSNVADVERLAKRSRKVFEQIQTMRGKANSKLLLGIPFQVRVPDYSTVRSQSSSMSTDSLATKSSNREGEGVGGGNGDSQSQEALGFLDRLALPLLASTEMEDVWATRAPVLVAFTGSLLAGVGMGAFWTICEVLLTPTQTAIGLLLASFGAITGTRLMGFSKHQFMFISAVVGGSFGSYLFAYTPMPLKEHTVRLLVAAWLVGNMFGAWTAHLPRQFINAALDSALARSLVAIAPLLGSCLGSGMLILFQLDVGVFSLLYSLAWVVFTLVLLFTVPKPVATDGYATSLGDDSSEHDEEAPAQQPVHPGLTQAQSTHKSYWKAASHSIFRLGVLGSLFVDRTVRTLLVLEVVSFYPSMWGEDFFILSVGSLFASVVGTKVPAWASSLLGCVTMFALGGPGFCSWVWVEASCRSDMAKCTFQDAKHIELVLSIADVLAGVLFLLELSYLNSSNDAPGPWSTLDFGSMVLLLASSVGRVIAFRL